MATLDSVFKKVYKEGLEPYGFVKVKGKYPYFARMAGEDLVQIITYKKESCGGISHISKVFTILGGIFSVYRLDIPLDVAPRDIHHMLLKNSRIYSVLNRDNYDIQYSRSLSDFEYFQSDETKKIYDEEYAEFAEFSAELQKKISAVNAEMAAQMSLPNPKPMEEAMEYSFETTMKWIMPILEKMKTVEEFVSAYEKYTWVNFELEPDKIYGEVMTCSSEEGLAPLAIYSKEQYLKHEMDMIKNKNIEYEERHKTGELSDEDFVRLKNMNDIYKSYINEVVQSDTFEEFKKEAMRRKQYNTEYLKSKGIIK